MSFDPTANVVINGVTSKTAMVTYRFEKPDNVALTLLNPQLMNTWKV
jgi:hypothetical protein